ncbi:MAG: purine-nucleoside phosphorylase [Gammaproteobacteria bacterium]|jgi:purine-nucleoside phosphorylase
MSQKDDCLAVINQAASGFTPQVGMVLGSGLGPFADQVNAVANISFDDLPGFPQASVGGHAGRLVLGHVDGTRVAVFKGRAHYYEQGQADVMAVAIQTLKAMQCEALILTNAAGSMLADAGPGSVMLITDHINMTGVSPLFGAEGNQRFVDMTQAYHPEMNDAMRRAAQANDINLHEGVYAWMCGPNFETPAEINALKILGAQVVGMSTVPEVILARHQGLPLCALSIITNYAAGMSPTALSHEQTMEFAKKAIVGVERLLKTFLQNYETPV